MIFTVIPLLLSVALSTKGSTDLNITYVSTRLSWINAANYCSNHYGVLESNETLIMELGRNMSLDFKHVKHVWIGQYESLTAWAYIYGCFKISAEMAGWRVEHNDQLECQKQCEYSPYFAVQNTTCFCIDDDRLPFISCKCNDLTCLTVWKHFKDRLDDAGSTEPLCIAATQCYSNFSSRTTVRKAKDCSAHFNVTCDDGTVLGFDYKGQKMAAEKCFQMGSFIKWYDVDYCQTFTIPNQLWTSGIREIKRFRHKRTYNLSNLQLQQAYRCSRNCEWESNFSSKYSFFCRFSPMEDDDLIPVESVTKNMQTTDSAKGIAIGAVTVIIVIAVSLIAFFIYRRRINKSKPSSDVKKTTDNVDTSLFVEVNGENSNLHGAYNNHDPRTIDNSLQYGTEISGTIKESFGQQSDSLVYFILEPDSASSKYNQSIKNKNDAPLTTNNYCLAKPIVDAESDPYATNGAYDHLNNVAKKERLEHVAVKVYDHLQSSVENDPTYDHSSRNRLKTRDETYDHCNKRD